MAKQHLQSAPFCNYAKAMEIKRDEIKRKGSFYIERDGERVAELKYFRSGDGEITIYHTEVDEELRGRNVGEDLVKAAAKYARQNELKIDPQCPFARKVIERTAEYKSILA
ncbi:MAG: GNAT family N-acetyltransferase [Pyrinomonadaceae bacterium]